MGTLTSNIMLTLGHLSNRPYGALGESVSIGDHISSGNITVLTSGETQITFDTAVGNARELYVHNQNADSANYVRLGYATGDYKNRIRGGQRGSIPLEPGIQSIFVTAVGEDCLFEWMVTEEPT